MARKILLADDSVTAQNMGRRILTEAGYDVLTVNNGSAALKKLAEFKPDLVILDIYMPGYGGLEVCQRMKEGMETLSIPVLLTVGKLEPFRADEARRVHADAHLVKPFEASELLTALSKLEDKIIPRADEIAGKGASAGRKGSARGADFGDSVSGWKSRLGMPLPGNQVEESKAGESRPEEAKSSQASSVESSLEAKAVGSSSGEVGAGEVSSGEAPGEQPSADVIARHHAASAFRNFEHPAEEIGRVRPGTAASIYNGMVQDITPDEIAAIAAAAEVLGGGAGLTEAKSSTVDAEAASTAPTAEVASSNIDAQNTEHAAHEALASSAAQSGAESESVAAQPGHELENDSTPSPVEAPVEATPDADVVAALESLAPVADATDALYATEDFSHSSFADDRSPVPQEVAFAMGASGSSGPRWIAEEIPLGEGEASFILEREMQKVFAALAESNAERAREDVLHEAANSSAPPEPSVDSWASAYADAGSVEAYRNPDSSGIAREPHAVVADIVDHVVARSEAANSAADIGEAPAEQPEQVVEGVSVETASETSQEIASPPAMPEWSEEHSRAQVEAVAERGAAEGAGVTESGVESSEPAVIAATVPEEAISAVTTVVETTVAQATEPSPEAEANDSSAAHDAAAEPEAAYAAAASVGAGFRSINAISSTEASPASEEVAEPNLESPVASTAPASAETTRERESELAAAWAQWRQIRETIGNSSPAPVAADHAAETEVALGSNGVETLASAQPESGADAAADPSGDPSTIASIVDSMLAELRPKLVEEIAKKMGKQPK